MKDISVDLRTLATAAKSEVEDSKKTPTLGGGEQRVELTPREITFTVAYDSPDGKDLSATLKSRVLDADGRMAKMRVVAQLTRGVDVEQLSQEDHYRVDALARLSIQVIDPPDWVFNAAGMDLELLIKINTILLEHETRYFRGNARKGEADTLQERVRTSVPAFDKKGVAP